MWNHIEIMFLHGLDILCAFRLHKGLPVMCKGLPVMCHDYNHDSCTIAMMSQCKHDDVIHTIQT